MKKIVFMILVATVWFACKEEVNVDVVNVKFDEKTYLTQKQLWQSSNIQDYRYEIFSHGFSIYHAEITVENGDFKEEVLLNEDASSIIPNYTTIDKIFESIGSVFYNYQGSQKSDYYCTEISVEYDKVNHIPIQVRFEYYVSPDLAVDGNYQFDISNFSTNDP